MTTRLTFSSLLMMLLLFFQKASAQQFTVMSYNIRYDNPSDGINNWHERKHEMADWLKKQDCLLFGLQEGLSHQVTFIDSALTKYAYVGVGRNDGKLSGEMCPIFYRKEYLNLEETGTFWLSTSGDTGSIGWDAALPRICTYALFKQIKTGNYFYVFNCHLDHQGEQARIQSVARIHKTIDSLNLLQYPVILMGDLNTLPDSEPVNYLNKHYSDSRKAAAFSFEDNEGTFNGFNTSALPEKRIDYIFLKGIYAKQYLAITNKRKNGLWMSDHLPITVAIQF